MPPACVVIAALALLCGGASAAASATVDWSYHAPSGPYVWDKIVNASTGLPEYPDCGGRRQAPINICGGTPLAGPGPLVLAGRCPTAEFEFLETSFRWAFTPAPGDTCTATGQNGVVYDLIHFHVHAPSEHTLDGKRFGAELHFEHEAEDGSLLVVAVLLYADSVADNEWVSSAFAHLKDYTTVPSCCKTMTVPPYARLVPCDGGWYNYAGSLTTPPCSETVEWWVAATPLRISKSQLHALRTQQASSPFMNEWGGNNRPVQPLHSREVRAYGI